MVAPEPTATPEPTTYTLTGTFTLYDSDGSWGSEFDKRLGIEGCWGSGGYGDIDEGLDVVLRNGQGEIIANGNLGRGKPLAETECEFPFELSNIPESDFYEVSVGRRGSTVYSRSELEGRNWHLILSLGR